MFGDHDRIVDDETYGQDRPSSVNVFSVKPTK